MSHDRVWSQSPYYSCDNWKYRTQCKMYYYRAHATCAAIIAWSKSLLYDIKILLFHHNFVAGRRRRRRPIHNNISLNAHLLYCLLWYRSSTWFRFSTDYYSYGNRVQENKIAARTYEYTSKERNISSFVK